jgi:hypothetical protein
VSHYVRKSSVFGIGAEDGDARREHAARLLLTGWDVESAATMTGLQLDQVRAIAATVVDEFAARDA